MNNVHCSSPIKRVSFISLVVSLSVSRFCLGRCALLFCSRLAVCGRRLGTPHAVHVGKEKMLKLLIHVYIAKPLEDLSGSSWIQMKTSVKYAE